MEYGSKNVWKNVYLKGETMEFVSGYIYTWTCINAIKSVETSYPLYQIYRQIVLQDCKSKFNVYHHAGGMPFNRNITSTSHTSIVDMIVDHSDVVGAAPTTSSFST